MTEVRPSLISEETVARLPHGAQLTTTVPYVITPSAAEMIRHRRITLVPQSVGAAPTSDPKDTVVHFDSTAAAVECHSTPKASSEPKNLSGYLESTLLDPLATPEDIEILCCEALEEHFAGVCVNPRYVRQAAGLLSGSSVRTVSVCGFPLGASCTRTKAFEAGQAATDGADEVDMVMALGPLLAGDHRAAADDVREVRGALGSDGRQLKVIIETPLLSAAQIVQASVIALEGGADFIKTGTGFRGPARTQDVQLIRRVVGDRARIKAAGGIRSRRTALDMIAAGADRLGSSKAKELQ